MLDKVGHVHRHLIDLGAVVLLDVPQYPNVVILNEINSNAFATETTGSSDSKFNYHILLINIRLKDWLIDKGMFFAIRIAYN